MVCKGAMSTSGPFLFIFLWCIYSLLSIFQNCLRQAPFRPSIFTDRFLSFLPSLASPPMQRVLKEAQGYLQQGLPSDSDDDEDGDEAEEEKKKKAQEESGEGEDEETKETRRKRAEKIVAALAGGSKEKGNDE